MAADLGRHAPPARLFDPLRRLLVAAHDDVALHQVIEAMDPTVKSDVVSTVFLAEPDASLDQQLFALVGTGLTAALETENMFAKLI
jgi:hypothetical protein